MALLPTAKDGARDHLRIQAQCSIIRATAGLLFILQFQALAVMPWGTAEHSSVHKQLANTDCGILPSQAL